MHAELRNRAAAALLLIAGGCIPSNVVAVEDRAVAVPVQELHWDQPLPELLDGLYESIDIRGDVAGGLWKVWYFFGSDGHYSGAALVLGPLGPEFQTLSGSYRVVDGRLDLGDGAEPANLLAATDHLQVSSPEGEVVLRRVPQ